MKKYDIERIIEKVEKYSEPLYEKPLKNSYEYEKPVFQRVQEDEEIMNSTLNQEEGNSIELEVS